MCTIPELPNRSELSDQDNLINDIIEQYGLIVCYDVVANINKPKLIIDADGFGRFEDLPSMYKANLYTIDETGNMTDWIKDCKDNIHNTSDKALKYGIVKANNKITN